MTDLEKQLYSFYEMVLINQFDKSTFMEALYDIIDYESSKPSEVMDNSLINLCSQMLVNLSEEVQFKTNKRKIWRNIKRKMNVADKGKASSSSPRWGMRIAIITASLILVFFAVDLVFTRQWLIPRQSDDEQQYIIEANTLAPGIIPTVNANTVQRDIAMLTSSSLQDISDFLSYTPILPAWVPEGWNVENYTAILLDDGHEVIISYSKVGEKYFMQFGYRQSSNLTNLEMKYHQNKAGTQENVGNNLKVYFSQNYDRLSTVWMKENVLFDLSGPVTKSDATKVIMSLQ